MVYFFEFQVKLLGISGKWLPLHLRLEFIFLKLGRILGSPTK